MARSVDDAALDAALDNIANNTDMYVLCQGEPADYASATTLKSNGGNKIADTSVSGSDFSKADGDTSGRKLTVSGQSDVEIDEDGDVDHVALVDDTNSALKLVTVLDSTISVTSDGTADTDPFDEEIEDPTAP